MSIPQSTPEMTRWCALVISVVCFILASASVVQMVEAEKSGVAQYNPNPQLSEAESVLKASSPAKFHDAMFLFGCRIVFYGLIGFVCIWFYHRLSN